MSKPLNSRGQEQNDQIGSKELSENVTGPSNPRGKGARILAFYFRDGDSAAVRKVAAQWENNRGAARNVLRVYRMGKIGEGKPTEIEPHGAIAPLSVVLQVQTCRRHPEVARMWPEKRRVQDRGSGGPINFRNLQFFKVESVEQKTIMLGDKIRDPTSNLDEVQIVYTSEVASYFQIGMVLFWEVIGEKKNSRVSLFSGTTVKWCTIAAGLR
ncbi:hypothetical protein K438DRAFT_2103742 [Mycena galopus ATCC 62051]|nr:hypothetical protein K438DRAFT_2103742 [Mycena galopus ATCC 62051]